MGVPVSETTWLEGIVEANVQPSPDGQGKLLTYVLQNGHRYVIPLRGQLLEHTYRGLSPVVIAGNLPNNGHRA
jgi:hypothetical protein